MLRIFFVFPSTLATNGLGSVEKSPISAIHIIDIICLTPPLLETWVKFFGTNRNKKSVYKLLMMIQSALDLTMHISIPGILWSAKLKKKYTEYIAVM
jgi:hypothetical protein